MPYKQIKKKKEQLLVFFRRLGSLYYLSFTNHEILHNKIIGLDEFRKKILIVEDNNHRYDSRFINLCEVKTCRIKKVYSAINAQDFTKNKLEKYLDAIALEFDFKNGNTPFVLKLYKDAVHNFYGMAEVENKIKRWEGMLSKMLPAPEQKSA